MAKKPAKRKSTRAVGRQTKLTPSLLARAVDLVKKGHFDYIACQALGIRTSTWYEWLVKGEAGEEPYAEFMDKVGQARAHARGNAEAKVYDENPLAWLRYGPGRDRGQGAPGWTDGKTEVNVTNQQAIINVWEEDSDRTDGDAVRAAEQAYIESLDGEPSLQGGEALTVADVSLSGDVSARPKPAKDRNQGKTNRGKHRRNGRGANDVP